MYWRSNGLALVGAITIDNMTAHLTEGSKANAAIDAPRKFPILRRKVRKRAGRRNMSKDSELLISLNFAAAMHQATGRIRDRADLGYSIFDALV